MKKFSIKYKFADLFWMAYLFADSSEEAQQRMSVLFKDAALLGACDS